MKIFLRIMYILHLNLFHSFSGKLLFRSFNFQIIEGPQLVLHTLTVFFRPMTFHGNLLCILDPSCRKMLKKSPVFSPLAESVFGYLVVCSTNLGHAVKNLPKLWQHNILPLTLLADIDLNFLGFHTKLNKIHPEAIYL